LSAAVTAGGLQAFAQRKTVFNNKLPKWKGFNLLDFFSPDPAPSRDPSTEEHFKWMRDWGFDFVRVPMAYPHYLRFDRSRNILPEEVYQINPEAIDRIDALVALAHKYQMHVSLNLHRAPGYCINAGFHEPFNLWNDKAAQEAFYFHWGMWAKKYREASPEKISFDLLNEPSVRADMNDQHSTSDIVPGALYRQVVMAAADVIRRENPNHLVIADGNKVGNLVIPEITDLNVAQSCRGYYPHAISHYKAPWANKDIDHLPLPKWPGQTGDQFLSRPMLETYYEPWIQLMKQGVGVHCGECGCWNKTPHDVFLAWFSDVTEILSTQGIGFAVWNFIGDFGVLDSRRTDVAYEDWFGHQLDRKFLELLRKR
jgi:aryl-phospho-beta-D-glucosidase BglC (GH1 family)